MQLISLAMMEHKVLVLSRSQPNELEADLLLKKSVSSAAEQNESLENVDVQLKKSLSTSKSTFKRQITP